MQKVEAERFIDNNLHMSDQDLSDKTGRPVAFVRQRRAGNVVRQHYTDKSDLLGELHAKHYWETVKSRFLTEEIPYFEQEWLTLYDQFSSESVVHTDEIQMVDLITVQIFINRNLTRRKKVLQDIERAQNFVSAEESKDLAMQDRQEMQLKKQIMVGGYAQLDTLSREQENLEERKERIFKSLKSTRDQRLKQVEDRSKNFFGLIQYLDQKLIREREGKLLALTGLSAKKVTEDYSKPLEFSPTDIDSPFLDSESLSINNQTQEEISKEEQDV